jgi:peptidyl-prolyl cis-trans isomerase SurA
MRLRWIPPVVLLTLGSARAVAADPPPRHAGVLDRIVAVVDRDILLLSELHARSRPFLKQIAQAHPAPGAQRAAAQSQLMSELLGRMIEEVLVAAEADRKHITVAPDEIDRALQAIAAGQNITVPELLNAARDLGMTEKEYRDELRRQLLEGKLLQIRVSERVKGLSELAEPARAQRIEQERRQWIEELRKDSFIEVRL